MESKRDREGFERHAAPEAIRARLDQVRARVYEAHAELEWLEGLYIRRSAEKASGCWPYKNEAEVGQP